MEIRCNYTGKYNFIVDLMGEAGADYFINVDPKKAANYVSKCFVGEKREGLTPTQRKCSGPFQKEQVVSFLKQNLKESMVPSLMEKYGLTAFAFNEEILLLTLARLLEIFTLKDDDSFDDTPQTIYESIVSGGEYTKPNVDVSQAMDLLAEVDFRCPLTNLPLSYKDAEGYNCYQYRIVNILPSTLSEEELDFYCSIREPYPASSKNNQIALSVTAGIDYLQNPTIEKYETLWDFKDKCIKQRQLEAALQDSKLENDIKRIIKILGSVTNIERLETLSTDALRIEEKIPKKYAAVYNQIWEMARQYYFTIDTFMGKIDQGDPNCDPTRLAKAVRGLSKTMQERGDPIQEIPANIAAELQKISGGNAADYLPCQILVAYFVQHCEVLSK